jgi:hypothetical protein
MFKNFWVDFLKFLKELRKDLISMYQRREIL